MCLLCGRHWIFKHNVINISRNRLIKWYWIQQTAQSIIHNHVTCDLPTCFHVYKVIIREVYTNAYKRSTMVKNSNQITRGYSLWWRWQNWHTCLSAMEHTILLRTVKYCYSVYILNAFINFNLQYCILTLHTHIFDCICCPCISMYIPPW